MKKHNNSGKKNEPTSKRTKSRGPVQRDTKEVLAELVAKLQKKLDSKKVAATSAGKKHQSGELRPNLDRLTVGVDLGDQCDLRTDCGNAMARLLEAAVMGKHRIKPNYRRRVLRLPDLDHCKTAVTRHNG